MRLWIWMWKNGRRYTRSLSGFETYEEALKESHLLWHSGCAVMEEEIRGKWYVWHSP